MKVSQKSLPAAAFHPCCQRRKALGHSPTCEKAFRLAEHAPAVFLFAFISRGRRERDRQARVCASSTSAADAARRFEIALQNQMRDDSKEANRERCAAELGYLNATAPARKAVR